MTATQNTPVYWRTFYKIQEFLAKDFLEAFTANGNTGGIRNQSSLPQALNVKAHKLAEAIHEEPKVVAKVSEITKSAVSKTEYDHAIAQLDKGLRQMIHLETGADYHYLVHRDHKIIGGFTANYNGYLFGLFTLVKGVGAEVFKLQLDESKFILDSTAELHTYCFESPMCDLLVDAGFKQHRSYAWDERLAPILWDGTRFGTPSVVSYRL